MKVLFGFLVILAYVSLIGIWVYKRFLKNKKKIYNANAGAGKLIIDSGDQKIVIEYDHIRNKVMLEVTETGMMFSVLEGALAEPFDKVVRKSEVVMKAPEEIGNQNEMSPKDAEDLLKKARESVASSRTPL